MINFNDANETSGVEPKIGLKPSKKYANGTVHENGSGKFEILDRFLEDNIIMLKIKWLTGDNAGQTDVNKEANINASIWKFQKLRGIPTNPSARSSTVSNEDLLDVIRELSDKLDVMETQFQAQNKVIHMILETARTNVDTINGLVQQNDLVNKLIEKI